MSLPAKYAEWKGIPREEIDWHPYIDPEKCTGCGMCVTTCGREVFGYDEENHKAFVANPLYCLPGCTSCSVWCVFDAITFPDKQYIKNLIKEKKVLLLAKQQLNKKLEEKKRKEEGKTVKIAVPSDDGKTISHHFGRTKGFVVIELEKESNEIKNREYRTNTFTGHARGVERKHGEGHHRAIREGIGDCDVVIANSMGSGVYEDLKSAGMKIFITDESDIERAIELYISGKLSDNPLSTCEHHHHD